MQYTANGRYGVREFRTRTLVWFTDEHLARAYEHSQVALFLQDDARKAATKTQGNSFTIKFVARASLEDAQGKKGE